MFFTQKKSFSAFKGSIKYFKLALTLLARSGDGKQVMFSVQPKPILFKILFTIIN